MGYVSVWHLFHFFFLHEKKIQKKLEVEIMSVGLTKCWKVQEIHHSKAKKNGSETNKKMVDDCGVLQQHLLYLISVP